MAKTYKSGIVYTGDASGAVTATKLTRKELAQLNSSAKDTSKGFADIAKKAATWAAVAGGVALAGATAMIKKQMELIDTTAKTADRLGIATDKLTAMRIQAELTGVASNTLDMGLQRMVRRISEAAQGAGEAQGALKELNLDAQRLAQMSPDQQFQAIAEAMQNVGSQGDRVRLSFKLFDSEGVALVNTLKGGAAAALEAQQFTDQWGLALSRVDSAKVEQANDAMTLLGRASEGFWKQLTVQVSPAIAGVATEILGLGEDFGSAQDAASKFWKSVVSGAEVAYDAFRLLQQVGRGIVFLLQDSAANILMNVRAVDVAITALLNKLPGFMGGGGFEENQSLKRAYEDMAASARATAREIAETQADILDDTLAKKIDEYGRKAEEAARRAAEGANVATEEFENAGDAINGAGDAADKTAEKLQRILDKLYPQQKAARDLANEYDLLWQAVQRGDIGAEVLKDFREANSVALVAVDDLKVGVTDLAAEAEPFAAAWDRGLERVDDSFANLFKTMIRDGKLAFDDLKNVALDTLAEIIYAFARNKILLAIPGIGGSASAMASGGGAGGLGNLSGIGSKLLGGIGGIGSMFNQGVVGLAQLAGLDNMVGQGILGIGGQLSQFGGSLGLGANTAMLGGTLASAGLGYLGGMGGTAIGESLFGKQAESAWGASIGAAIGTAILPGLGSVIGGFLGGIADAAFGGDGKTRSAVGVQTNPGWRGADPGKSPIQIEAESGLLLTAYAKRAGDEAGDLATGLTQAFAATDAALTGFFDALGVTVDLAGQTLDGINSEFGSSEAASEGFFGAAGFNGELSADDLAGATDDFVRAWVDKVNELTGAGLDLEPIFALAQEGELLADVLIRVNAEFVAVNGALEALGMTAYDTSVAGMAMADGLAQAFGGLENMSGALAAYQQIAYTEEERLSKLRDQVAGAFDAMNMAMPDSIQALRQIIEGLDRTTAEGQKTFAALVQLAPALDQVTQAAEAEREVAIASARDQLAQLEQFVDEQKAQITEVHEARMEQLDAERSAIEQRVADARANLDTVFQAFQRGIEQRRASIQEQAQSEIDALNSQRDAITANYDDIASRINGSMDSVRESVQRLQREAGILRGALGRVSTVDPDAALSRQRAGVAAIRGGATGDDLERALSAATSATADMFASRVDFERAQGRAGNAIAGRLGAAQSALSREESVLESLQGQLAQAASTRDRQLEKLDEQVQAVTEHRDRALAGLDQQIQLAERQIEAIGGTSTNVATLTDVTRAIATYEQAQEMSIFQIEAIDRARIEAEKQWITQMEYLSAEFSHNQLMLENAIKQESNLRAIWDAQMYMANRFDMMRSSIMAVLFPDDEGYATGGIASGPMSGYTATLHGTEAVIPLGRGDIPVMVHGINDGNQAVAAEIRALRTEVSDLKSELRQIRTNTGDSAGYHRKWEYRGMPETREATA